MKANAKPYRVKEMFYSLQGEGARAGRPAIFCRFSKCNLWNGREEDRAMAICRFCDTDFVGTDGQNGGEFASAQALVKAARSLWQGDWENPYIIMTGGEPLLQLDEALVSACHLAGFEVGVETNGTLSPPAGVDWLCVSPKADAKLMITQCDELKLVYPQSEVSPEDVDSIKASYYFLSPKNEPGSSILNEQNTRACITYCLSHPKWRLTLQTHKLLGID